jgi:ADP-ribose pyrophosphatase
MTDSPARRRPRREPTGRADLDSVVADLTLADETLLERVTERQTLYRGRYMTFEKDAIALADGRASSRDLVVHPGAVVIAPVDEDGRLLLVTQFRVAAGGALLELPAGTLDVHDGIVEDPVLAAHRELEEETGHRAGRLERIGGFWTAPGFSTEYLTLFLAMDLRPAVEDRLAPDEDERLLLSRLHWRDAVAAIEAGVIEDAKSIAGILWVARMLEREGA